MTTTRTLNSPLGPLRVEVERGAVTAIAFSARRAANADEGDASPRDRAALDRVASQLSEYFAGTRTRFELALAPRGTAFQRAVWAELAAIPFAEKTSYAALAARVGRPRAARAVGAANARNPVAIVLPCHRVIGSSGALTGYAGGLGRKAWLLGHEARAERAPTPERARKRAARRSTR